MRYLVRDPLAPLGLHRYRHGRDTWSADSPNARERENIWVKLDAMQGTRCAYCEASIASLDRHIEHFQQRNRHPQGTFDWHNLFGSCNRRTSCGKHKDNCGHYTPNDLIKPDNENPENLLVFTPNGAVMPRANLDAVQQRRAEETIRILNLNGALSQIRRAEVFGYLQIAEEIAQLAQDFSEDEWLPILQEELQRTANLPFSTAIKHVLTPQHE
ncbi:retron Ec78 anti-phage system effector HNH endonuclease PtuB [Pseudomonas sp. RW10S2]|uniref:retron Ec78 anti-phage system effector HNH endonuclease PtuB n=1 Tax=Pseudomonas TaxID=286 RepID=UPI001647BD44|nr:retron Ec78 anti-phage system effector HNH endonuclease PtuB [Pseudomonas sp. RW10S2]MBC3467844.1 TIGR02646 family protein [Pseudomonas sp. RW10S2]